jgi:hypothetical protein
MNLLNFREISQIDKINNFIVYDLNLFYLSKCKIYKNSSIIKELDANFFGQFYIVNNEILIQSYLGEFEFINVKYSGFYNYSNTVLLTYINPNDNCLYKIVNGKIEKTIYSFNIFSVEKHFFANNDSILSKIDWVNGIIWQFSTSNLPIYETSSGEQKHPTVKKFIGVWENQLVVECNRGIILFLDITTGELLHTLDLNADFKYDFSDHLDASTYYISINTSLNKLIILAPAFLYHFDLKLKTLSVIKDYLNVEISEKWNFKSATFVDDLIYFTGDYGQQYVVATRVGVLNSQTGEVLWQTQLEKTGGLNTAPQVAGDKLYVLSQKNVLYIFEKEG